jgi:hypothetical protein
LAAPTSTDLSTDLSSYIDARSGMVNFEIKAFDVTGSSTYFLSAKSAPTLAAALGTGKNIGKT